MRQNGSRVYLSRWLTIFMVAFMWWPGHAIAQPDPMVRPAAPERLVSVAVLSFALLSAVIEHPKGATRYSA